MRSFPTPSLRSTRACQLVATSALGVVMLAACANDATLNTQATITPSSVAASSSSGSAATGGAGQCTYPVSGNAAKPVDPPSSTGVVRSGTTTAVMHMAAGDVTITLDRAKAPCTTNSFVSLVQQKYFDNTKCHRLTDSGIFVLQCGDPTATGTGGPGYSFPDELTGAEKYPAGTVAMANAGADTNGSQFFIVWQDTTLDPAYTVFGKVDAAGLKVVQSIASQGVSASDGTSPIADASITSITLG